MKKVTGFKKGYYIRIINGFYEVIAGNRVCFYGYCRRNATVEEIANETIGLNKEGMDDKQRFKRIVRKGREERSRARNQDYGTENVVGL